MNDTIGIKLVITSSDGQETALDMSACMMGGVIKGHPDRIAGGSFGKLGSHDVVNSFMTVCRAFIHVTNEQIDVIRETIGEKTGVLPDRAPTDFKELRRMMVRIVDMSIEEEVKGTETLDYREGIAKFRIGGGGEKQ